MPVGTGTALALGLGASAIGSGIAAGRGKKVTVKNEFDPTSAGLRDQTASVLSDKLSQPLSIDPNLLAQVLGGTNKAFNLGVGNLQDQFSSRGLGQSGLFGGSLSNLQMARMGKISDVINQLAGTAEDRQARTLSQAISLSQPTGSTQNQAGSLAGGIGGGLSDLGTTLGLMAALGLIGGNKKNNQGLDDIVKDLTRGVGGSLNSGGGSSLFDSIGWGPGLF